MTKHNFDQTPVLLETFDQLIRSSEIRSTDPLSQNPVHENKFYNFTEILLGAKSIAYSRKCFK